MDSLPAHSLLFIEYFVNFFALSYSPRSNEDLMKILQDLMWATLSTLVISTFTTLLQPWLL